MEINIQTFTLKLCMHVGDPLLHTTGENATSCGARTRSHAVLSARVAALSVALRTRLACSPGAVVALAAQSSDVLLEAWLAVAAAGCVAAPLNPRWRVLPQS